MLILVVNNMYVAMAIVNTIQHHAVLAIADRLCKNFTYL